MNNPETLQLGLHHTPAKSWKLTNDQPPRFQVEADVALPIGPVVAKAELGISVEGGEVKPKFQARLEGLLADWVDAATNEPVSQLQKRRDYGYSPNKGARTPSRNTGKHGRGHRGAGR